MVLANHSPCGRLCAADLCSLARPFFFCPPPRSPHCRTHSFWRNTLNMGAYRPQDKTKKANRCRDRRTMLFASTTTKAKLNSPGLPRRAKFAMNTNFDSPGQVASARPLVLNISRETIRKGLVLPTLMHPAGRRAPSTVIFVGALRHSAENRARETTPFLRSVFMNLLRSHSAPSRETAGHHQPSRLDPFDQSQMSDLP